jgi:hypothetical protein
MEQAAAALQTYAYTSSEGLFEMQESRKNHTNISYKSEKP